MTSPNPDQLRARAAALRGQARALDSCRLLQLHLRAGTDVWVGPTANAFLDDLASATHRVRAAADSLRDAARDLDLQAMLANQAILAAAAAPVGVSAPVGTSSRAGW